MATANSPAAGEPSATAQERMDAAYGASERIRNLNKPYAQPMFRRLRASLHRLQEPRPRTRLGIDRHGSALFGIDRH